MSESIRLVEYFHIKTPNKPGEAARALAAIKSAGVNLLAFSGFPRSHRAQLDFIPADPGKFVKAARKAGMKLSARKRVFFIQGEDRVGAMADILKKLSDSGINVTAVDAVCAGSHRYGTILWVKAADTKRAAKALGMNPTIVPA